LDERPIVIGISHIIGCSCGSALFLPIIPSFQ
jgi:hypothetical protein